MSKRTDANAIIQWVVLIASWTCARVVSLGAEFWNALVRTEGVYARIVVYARPFARDHSRRTRSALIVVAVHSASDVRIARRRLAAARIELAAQSAERAWTLARLQVNVILLAACETLQTFASVLTAAEVDVRRPNSRNVSLVDGEHVEGSWLGVVERPGKHSRSADACYSRQHAGRVAQSLNGEGKRLRGVCNYGDGECTVGQHANARRHHERRWNNV